jgi:hypothetical protein
MIDLTQIETNYNQNGRNTCVLAAYATVNSYFTGTHPCEAFSAYCDHHHVSHDGDTEAAFMTHCGNYRSGGMHGSERMLKELHQNSQVEYFTKGREYFDGRVIDPLHVHEMEKELRETESLLSIGIRSGNGMCHVITIGATENGFVIRDTNKDEIHCVETLNGVLNTFYRGHVFTDGVVYCRK